MNLKFTINPEDNSYMTPRLDYTDYVLKVSLKQHTESLLQSAMPDCSITIVLSTVLPDTIKVGTYVYWGVGGGQELGKTYWSPGKEIAMVIKKIDRSKHDTTIWAAPRTDQGGEFIKGLVTPTTNWGVISGGKIPVDESILDVYRQHYVQDVYQLYLSMANSTRQKALIEHNVSSPLSRGNSSLSPCIRQVQTAAEYALDPKPYVVQYKISHQDVVDEELNSSQVLPNFVTTSRLNQQRKGIEIVYDDSSTWETALQKIRLHECPQGGLYGVSLVNGDSSELHLSDGSFFTVQGIVVGVASECIYVYQTSDSTIKAISFEGTVLSQISLSNFSAPATHNIFQDFNTKDVVCQLRQTGQQTTKPSDLVFFGRPVVQGYDMYIGVARYRNNGSVTMSLIKAPFVDYPVPDAPLPYQTFDMSGCWLLGAYKYEYDGNYVIATYGKQGGVVQFRVQYDGTIANEPYNYDYEFYTSDSSIYPISSAKNDFLYSSSLTGYSPTSPRLRFGSVSTLAATSVTWSSISGDTAFMGWYAGTRYSIITRFIKGLEGAVRHGNGWRPVNRLTPYSFEPIEDIANGWYVIVGQFASVVVLNDMPNQGKRTIYIEPSPLPFNTYALYSVKTQIHDAGEGGEASLPYLLQGGGQSWEMLPVSNTRIKVRTSALTCRAKRTGSVIMQTASGSSLSWQYLYERSGTSYYVKPGHVYYMSVEILAPQGIQATQAEFFYPQADRLVLIDLNNTPASSEWVKKSALATVPASFVDQQRSYRAGARSVDNPYPWLFRKPILVDLTQTYGQGNEPTQEWCDANLIQFDVCNIFDPANTDWYVSKAVCNTALYDSLHHINNDTFVTPQIGCPILYQRIEGQGNVDNHIVVDCQEGWEDLYIPFNVVQGITYTIKFDWKVNSTYQPLNQDYPGVMLQVLNSQPAGDGNMSVQVARIDLPTQEGTTSQELTFTASATGTYYFDFNFGGAADSQTVDVNVQNMQVIAYGDDVLGDALKSLINWKQSVPRFAVTSTGGLEEGIILGFDYEFGGATSLWVDILLLGQPKPWSDSYLTN